MAIRDEQERKEPKSDSTAKPDPGTEHNTDPQEHMEGPVSSTIKGIGDAFETGETKQEADEERDRKI